VHEPADLARDEIDVAVGEQQPDVLAEGGDGGTRDRSGDIQDDGPRPRWRAQAFERSGGLRVGRGQESLLGVPFPEYDHARSRNSPAPRRAVAIGLRPTSDLEDDDVGRAGVRLEVGVGGAGGGGVPVTGGHLWALVAQGALDDVVELRVGVLVR